MRLPLRLLLLGLISHSFTEGTITMNTMLMNQNISTFLSYYVSTGNMNQRQMQQIMQIFDRGTVDDGNPFVVVKGNSAHTYYLKDSAKDDMRDYLMYEASEGLLDVETVEQLGSALMLGELYPTADDTTSSSAVDGPVPAVYNNLNESDGNLVRLGRWNQLSTASSNHYNGIWGYFTGIREYALQCHGDGLNIIDVTDAVNTFRVQLIPMGGGGVWRDVATHEHTNGTTYAYVGKVRVSVSIVMPCDFECSIFMY